MMKSILFISAICFSTFVFGQDLSFSKPGNQYYTELPNPVATDKNDWSKLPGDVFVSFASDNEHYPKEKRPEIKLQKTWSATSWKGEKINTQLLIATKKDIPSVSITVSDLNAPGGKKIAAANIKAAFVRYTLADGFKDGCSQSSSSHYDSFLVADPIDIVNRLPVASNTVQPVWLSIDVPASAATGNYKGTLTINAAKKYVLNVEVAVVNRVLPPPAQWKYDFDIWQYTAPIARIHNVPLWSDEHFKLMKQYFTYLAQAGQKVITANIIEQPWGLDHVHFDDPTLIKWTKKRDGSWNYDFTMFDKFVKFMMDCGITQRINCYTMITWDLGFIYFDEATGKNKTDTLKPGSEAYTAFWKPMIEAFTKHLKQKGWFSITAIAVDERPLESMQAIIRLLKSVDPSWRIALAGDTYHPEIEEDIYDYCLASYLNFGDDVIKKRKAAGKPTTFYTACVEEYPNSFTASPPAENTWLSWYAAARGLTGYLFWAYNTWVADPLHDTRWRRYPAGELFQYYPGPRSSIRFEKLREGIQDFEKIRILRETFTAAGNTKGLDQLDEALSKFQLKKLKETPAASILEEGKKTLARLSAEP